MTSSLAFWTLTALLTSNNFLLLLLSPSLTWSHPQLLHQPQSQQPWLIQTRLISSLPLTVLEFLRVRPRSRYITTTLASKKSRGLTQDDQSSWKDHTTTCTISISQLMSHKRVESLIRQKTKSKPFVTRCSLCIWSLTQVSWTHNRNRAWLSATIQNSLSQIQAPTGVSGPKEGFYLRLNDSLCCRMDKAKKTRMMRIKMKKKTRLIRSTHLTFSKTSRSKSLTTTARFRLFSSIWSESRLEFQSRLCTSCISLQLRSIHWCTRRF